MNPALHRGLQLVEFLLFRLWVIKNLGGNFFAILEETKEEKGKGKRKRKRKRRRRKKEKKEGPRG